MKCNECNIEMDQIKQTGSAWGKSIQAYLCKKCKKIINAKHQFSDQTNRGATTANGRSDTGLTK